MAPRKAAPETARVEGLSFKNLTKWRRAYRALLTISLTPAKCGSHKGALSQRSSRKLSHVARRPERCCPRPLRLYTTSLNFWNVWQSSATRPRLTANVHVTSLT